MNRYSISTLAMLAIVVILPSVSAQQQIVPPAPIQIATPIVTINNSTGDQTDPHVSKDLAVYSNFADHTVHYYTFSTGIDIAIPIGGQSNADTLPRVR